MNEIELRLQWRKEFCLEFKKTFYCQSRLPGSLAPAAFNVTKLISSLLLQGSTWDDTPLDNLSPLVMAPLSEEDDGSLRSFYVHPGLRIYPFSYNLFIDYIMSEANEQFFMAFVSNSSVCFDPIWRRLAQQFILPDRVATLEKILNRAIPDLYIASQQPVVIEEKPGRLKTLSIQHIDFRSTAKTLHSHRSSHKDKRHFTVAEPGWSAGVFRCVKTLNRDGRRCQFYRFDVAHLLSGDPHKLITAIVECVCLTLQQNQIQDSTVAGAVLLSLPFLEVAVYMASLLEARVAGVRIVLSDYLYGWHPVSSLLQILSESDVPYALGVFSDKLPSVDILLVMKSYD